jgi:L-ascorbate metabolism protein UlaG (beta-lactamase superfamily)
VIREPALCLRGDIVAEPLINSWYAWPHLISPATCPMNVAGRHLKIMRSYEQSPQIHASAVRNPKMLGGPFIDYEGNRVPEIRRLIDHTRTAQARHIEFAEAVRALNELLRREATGFCLDPLYERIPEPLRGYVEIFYDLRNVPSYRFFEPLLYRSDLYDRSLQTLHTHATDNDHRPFALSTPRLPDDKSVTIRVPFESPALDSLFATRYRPGCVPEIAEALQIPAADRSLFRSFFTEERPPARTRYQGGGIRIRYFGHACLLLETPDFSLMSDPVVSFPYRGANSRYTYEDLPPAIDFVVITHNHQDHVLIETLLQLRHMIGTVVVPRNGGGQLQDPSLKLTLKALGFANVVELDEMETIDLPRGVLTALPFLGEHADLGIRAKLCHHVSVGCWSTVFAADSCAIDIAVYRRVHQAVGDIDVLFIGMECDGAPLSWLYGSLLAEPVARDQDRSRKLSGSNFERASALVELFHPKEVYVYAMGQEPWLNYIMSIKYTEQSLPITESNRLIAWCRERGIVAERLFCMKETFYGAQVCQTTTC